jgi:hypothetical protein
LLINVAIVVLSMYMFGHWVAGAAAAVLLLIWKLLPQGEGPPVLALALTAQWVQISLGVFYVGLTGRELEATRLSEWVPMVLIGLGGLVSLTTGLWLGIRYVKTKIPYPEVAPVEVISFRNLVIVYFIAIFVTGTIQQAAFQFPQLTQAILALSFARLGIMALMFRRLTQPTLRYIPLFSLILFEVALGFTGFFSDFREPLLLAGLALLEGFDRHRREHWITAGVLAVVLSVAVLMWLSVRAEFRADFDDQQFATSRSARVERMQALSTDWLERSEKLGIGDDVDLTIDRIWAIYYPALAVERVPRNVPHTNGSLMGATLYHMVTPRLFFPDKPPLPNDSEYVRKYSGAEVAGAEEGTTIAFGYMVESYVDFGVPVMFIPMLIFGFGLGCAYVAVTRKIAHRELAIALATCIFWMNLNMFERAWAKMLGMALTTMIYLGFVSYMLDSWLLSRHTEEDDDEGGEDDDAEDGDGDGDEGDVDQVQEPEERPAPLFGRAGS